MLGIVPVLQSKALQMGFIPESIKAFMAHPAGPFTSKCCPDLFTLYFCSFLLGSNLQMDDYNFKHR